MKPSTDKSIVVDTLKGKNAVSNLMMNEKVKKLLEEGQEIYHFGFGQSPFKPMPQVLAQLSKYGHHNEYLPIAGLPKLHEAIKKFHKKYDGIDISVDDIIITPGSKQSIFTLISILKNDVILVSPSWLSYNEQCIFLGKKSHVILTKSQDNWKVNATDLEQVILSNEVPSFSALILCNPDNPTSTVYDEIELQEIAKVCRKYKIIVISDEIYGRFRYDGNHQSMFKYYPEGTIITSGFSKWASLGGWRLGYSIIPPELCELKKSMCIVGSNSFSCVAAPIQYAVAEMIENEADCEDYINTCARVMNVIGQYCHRELTSVGIDCVKPGSGFYMLPCFRVIKDAMNKQGITTSQQLCDKLFSDTSVVVLPAGPDFLRPEDEFTVRLAYVNFDGQKVYDVFSNFTGDFNDEFIKTNFPLTVEGIQRIKKWVQHIVHQQSQQAN